jgi:esterase
MKLNHTIFRAGKAIILIHGLFGSGDNLRRLSHALSKNYMVISPDLRNHGRIPDMSEDGLSLYGIRYC